VLVVAGLIAAGRSFKVVQQYEQGIIFRFGRVVPGTRGAGLIRIRPVGDRLQKVNMQIIAMAVPAQEGITRDNVTVRVDAVVYFRVVDPIKATINVQNYMFAISQQAQTSLRSIIGQSEMDQLLSERDSVNRELRRIIDEPTEGPWGIRVERVELKDVSLPENMKRSMSRPHSSCGCCRQWSKSPRKRTARWSCRYRSSCSGSSTSSRRPRLRAKGSRPRIRRHSRTSAIRLRSRPRPRFRAEHRLRYPRSSRSPSYRYR
jgi:hypothetical protein